MPASPWKHFAEAKADQEYLVQLTYLPLKRYRMLFRFLRYSAAIQKQLANADGLLGFSLMAHPVSREFWTLSVWTSRDALMRFTGNMPHGHVMQALSGRMRPTVFIDWRINGSQCPPSWKDVLERFRNETKLPKKGTP